MKAYIMNDGQVHVSTKCPFCQKEQTVVVPYDNFMQWNNGAYAQDAFPMLKPSEREIFVAGICDDCWPKEEEPHNIFDDWQVVYTGGNCKAYRLDMQDKTYFLATDINGINLPYNMDEIMLGHYNLEDEPIYNPYIIDESKLEEIIETYKQIKPGLKYENVDD